MSKKIMQPIHANLLVRYEKPSETTNAGVYLPESARETVLEGVVVAVGPGKINEDGVRTPPPVKSGDSILFRNYLCEVDVDDQSLVLITENNILGKLEKITD